MRKNKKKNLMLILLLLIAAISIGYAALTTTLNINGNTTIEKASWDVHFENLAVTKGSVTATTPATIAADTTIINYEVKLEKPGDFYEFEVDMVNGGTIDAMISDFGIEGVTEEQDKYIEYEMEYNHYFDAMFKKDAIRAGKKERIRVGVYYKTNINPEDLPTEDTTLQLTFKVIFVQADESARDVSHSGPELT